MTEYIILWYGADTDTWESWFYDPSRHGDNALDAAIAFVKANDRYKAYGRRGVSIVKATEVFRQMAEWEAS